MDGDEISNFYESKVFDEIRRYYEESEIEYDEDQYYDIACLALNQLPCRYFRYRVDAVYFLEQGSEKERMDKDVQLAVKNAFEKVIDKPRQQ